MECPCVSSFLRPARWLACATEISDRDLPRRWCVVRPLPTSWGLGSVHRSDGGKAQGGRSSPLRSRDAHGTEGEVGGPVAEGEC